MPITPQQRVKAIAMGYGVENAGCHFRVDITGCLDGALTPSSASQSPLTEKSTSDQAGDYRSMERSSRQEVVDIQQTPRTMPESYITSTVITSLDIALTSEQLPCGVRTIKTIARQPLTRAPATTGPL